MSANPSGPSQDVTDSPQNAEWICYILRCSDGTLYTGVTNDMDKRLAAHNAGTAAKYTRTRGPVTLLRTEVCVSKSAALKREAAIKSMPRAEKLALAQTPPYGP